MRFLPRSVAAVAAFALAAGTAHAQEWSTITGTVVYAGGDVPERPALDVNKDKEVCLKKGPLLSEKWVVDPKTKGLRDVLIWLAPAAPGGKLPVAPSLAETPKPYEMDQPCCQFAPHVFAIRAGQDLVVKNSDPIPHNVKWGGFKNPGGNVIIPAGQQFVIKGSVAERLPMTVNCNIHPWMEAKVGVFDHPYFAVTNEKGEFTIKDAPAGKFRLVVWHETGYLGGKAGSKGQEVEIKAGKTELPAIKFKAN